MVSIIMAVHNGEHFIESALRSVQSQTYKDFECIIVDDHSSDSTAAVVCEKFCKTDPRFKLYVNMTDVHKPYVDAHNLSYKLGTGKYLIRFDGDDIMLPNHVETLVKYMDLHDDVAFCCTIPSRIVEHGGYTTEYNLEENLNPVFRQYEKESVDSAYIAKFNEFPEYYEHYNWIHWFNQASCLRKSWYDDHLPKFTYYKNGDFMFFWTVLSLGGKVHKIAEHTLLYRMHDKSICHRINFAVKGAEYYWQKDLACLKAKAFGQYPDNTVFPDGKTAGEYVGIFNRTVKYFDDEITNNPDIAKRCSRRYE